MAHLAASLGIELPLPPLDVPAADAVRARQARLTKPAGSLGRLETLVAWLAAVQGRAEPRLERVRIAVFAGWHGVNRHGVSAYPPEVTAQMVANFRAGGAAINQLAEVADAELRVVVPADAPTRDFTEQAAMDEAGCRRALAAGAAVVEGELDLLALGEMGIGNTTAASAICALLFDEPAARWTGPGTGLDGEGVAHKARVVERACTVHHAVRDKPRAVLAAVGGHEIAAMTGAIVAARAARVPVLLDGFVCGAAAAVARALAPDLLEHCEAGHRSAEPAHAQLLERLGKRPLLDLGMRLGEASGAALAIPLVRAALACHRDMATFEQAGVADRA